MINHLEDAFISESNKLGFAPSRAAMIEFATQFAGSKSVGDFIITPANEICPISEVVSAIRDQMPDAFSKNRIDDTMSFGEIRRIRETRMPSDWNDVRKRYTGLTAQMMDERAAARQR